MLIFALMKALIQPIGKPRAVSPISRGTVALDVAVIVAGCTPQERLCMIIFLLGTSTIAGVGLGWYGYKARLRIAEWGRGMDECDQIFQAVAEETEGANFGKRIPKDGPRIVPFVIPHLRP